MPKIRNPERWSLPFRQARLEALCHHVQGCRACSRMEGRRRVLSGENGTAAARVMFVAEAPGRHGADQSGIPLHGDATGGNFQHLLGVAGWGREEVFVTNAVLCNPRGEDGRNDRPSQEEIAACSFHLEAQVTLVRPLVLCTLGAVALGALEEIAPHGLVLSGAAGKPHPWLSTTLFPLYHPSPRAMLYRPFVRQEQDFRDLRRLMDSLEKGRPCRL